MNSRQQLTHNAEDGDEVFLGPKMSFASASAARQAVKGGSQEGDESRKFDRFAARDRDPLREREGRDGDSDRRRDRFRDANASDLDGKQRFRNKQSVDEDEERASRIKSRSLHGRDEEPKRAGRGLGRGKFDQPWFRDATKDTPVDEAAEAKNGWREEKPRRTTDREWSRGQKVDEDPGWELPGQGEAPAHTVDDFQKWKERMKAGDVSGPPQADSSPAVAEEQPAEKPKMVMQHGSFFGSLGAAEDKTPELPTPKPAPNKKDKSSRFQSFFAPKDELLQPEQHDNTPAPAQQVQPTAPPTQNHQRLSGNNDDQAGFERMMAMLRMGGTGSQGPGPQLFTAPPAQSLPPPSSKRPPQGPPSGLPSFFDSAPGSPPVSTPNQLQPAATPPSQPASRQQTGPDAERNSQFLLNLMKSQQPRTPFTEGQIYGQGYERKTPENELDRFAPPAMPRSRGPPPGFGGNNGPAFASNGMVDSRLMSNPQSPQRNIDNGDDRARQMKEQHRFPPGMPMFDQPPPPHMFNGGRAPSPQRMPPPGFSGRPPPPPSSQHLPPGFFPGGPQFPPQHMNQQSGVPGGVPHRGPIPPQQQPPGFFNAPPGFPNMPPGMQGPPPNQRRSGGMPPGFDVYGAGPGPNGRPMMGPGAPPPGQQPGPPQGQPGYAQYAQQMGAGGYK